MLSDNHFQQSRHAIINASASCSLPLPRECEKISRKRGKMYKNITFNSYVDVSVNGNFFFCVLVLLYFSFIDL